MSPHTEFRSFSSVTGFDPLDEIGHDRVSYARAKLVAVFGGAVLTMLTTLIMVFAALVN